MSIVNEDNIVQVVKKLKEEVCCLEENSFTCTDVDECLGISEEGDPSFFLNEQGQFVEVSGGASGIDDVLAIGQSLTAARSIDLATNTLDFNCTGGSSTININAGININASGTGVETYSFNTGTDYQIRSSGTDGDAIINLGDYNDGAKPWIKIAPPTGINTYNAPNGHVFNGKINATGLTNYANNAAALVGGLSVGDFYYTNVAGDGILKIVL